jgi:hypothetical protein
MRVGGHLELRTDLIACEATSDECDAEGWTVTVEGQIVDFDTELGGHPIMVADSICRRIEDSATSVVSASSPEVQR